MKKGWIKKGILALIIMAIFIVPISTGLKINKTNAQITGTNVIQYNGPDKEWTAPNTSTKIISNEYGCGVNPATWFSNCIALLLYETIFTPIATFAKFAAKILDFFVYYSTNSDSYTSGFVTKAWSAVRDVANIFFIVALLYVAIKTILSLNVTDNKKLIGYVVVIALIINFSLFTTKVVIDGSNILAKIFYNNIVSKDATTTNADGTLKDSESGAGGEKSISVGLVKQFNPQDIIGKDNIINNIGETIFITLLAITMMGFMIYVFLSVALLFVARVISLWLSMIFSPIAFASYTVPFDIPGFGHKEWWKGLFENAFLAPLFIFFLYIIILFGDFLTIIKYDTQNTDLIQTAMKTIIPFAIIVMLLMKAKKLAVQYSGEMGAAVMKGAAAIGGLALGGAALGTAALGRGIVGRVTAKASRSEDAMHYGKAKVSFDDKIAKWKKEGGVKPTWETHKAEYIRNGGKNFKENPWTALGGKVNASQILTKDVDHARHEVDEAKKKAGLEGVSNANLSGVEKEKIQDTFIREKKPDIERDIKNGFDAKGIPIKDPSDPTGERNIQSESEFKAKKRNIEVEKVKEEGIESDLDTATRDGLSDQGRKKVEDQLNQAYNAKLKDLVKEIGKIRFSHLEKEAEVKVSGLKRMVSKSTSGSYDVRSIPDLKTDKREGLSTKATVGLISAVAVGMRAGLKSSLNIDAGAPQKSIGKDLANTITSALKGVKIDVKLGGDNKESHGGGGHGSVGEHSGHGGSGGHDAHGGGGASHGGGGHDTHGGGGGDKHH